MKPVIAVAVALFAAAHVSVPALGLAAPVPVCLAFGAVLGGMGWLVYRTARLNGFRITPVPFWLVT
ncbi:MAG: hypothetical protein ACRDNS_14065 [Trebonia sp.]